ncbi:hypothetical protein C8Q75DRAFT_891328 [Abortiporus biennis]|nr:hypothetical protein C8Q75DRAFT_891328 [Abortiporus biennis]
MFFSKFAKTSSTVTSSSGRRSSSSPRVPVPTHASSPMPTSHAMHVQFRIIDTSNCIPLADAQNNRDIKYRGFNLQHPKKRQPSVRYVTPSFEKKVHVVHCENLSPPMAMVGIVLLPLNEATSNASIMRRPEGFEMQEQGFAFHGTYVGL